MSEHHVEVVTIDKIEAHDNADSLEIAWHAGYPVVVRKGEFRAGDLATYIPVDAVVPEGGEFASIYPYTRKGRVKAARLRGRLSMGLLWSPPPGATLGEDVADYYGITKYEPPLRGLGTQHDEGMAEPPWFLRYTDIEGYRRWPDILEPGEPVVITEKLHGANARFAYHEGQLWVGSRRQVVRADGENVWARVARQYDLVTRLRDIAPGVILFGELLGVQDLPYALNRGEVGLRVFDLYDPQRGCYYNDHTLTWVVTRQMGLPLVPRLYTGPWETRLLELAEGQSTLAGHVREGIVIRPQQERYDPRLGRVILKHVGEGYLLRKPAA